MSWGKAALSDTLHVNPRTTLDWSEDLGVTLNHTALSDMAGGSGLGIGYWKSAPDTGATRYPETKR